MRNVMLLLVIVGCGGGSGVDESKRIVDLSESEIDDVCTYVIAEQGGARAEECEDEDGNFFTVEFPDFDECVEYLLSYEGCDATVRQEEECAEKLGDNPCDDPAACHASDDC